MPVSIRPTLRGDIHNSIKVAFCFCSHNSIEIDYLLSNWDIIEHTALLSPARIAPGLVSHAVPGRTGINRSGPLAVATAQAIYKYQITTLIQEYMSIVSQSKIYLEDFPMHSFK